MKKILLIACLLLPLSLTKLSAQVSNSAEFPAGNNANTVGTNMPTQPKYGAVRYDSLLHALPEYTAMEAQLAELRKQHETEAAYNETTFKRMFAEFLQREASPSAAEPKICSTRPGRTWNAPSVSSSTAP